MAEYKGQKRIDAEAIVDGEIQEADIQAEGIGNADIVDGAVDQTAIGSAAVDDGKLSSTFDISTKQVTYRPFVTGDLADGSIAGNKLGSGAAIDNLGYTPVNRAGDTMTGQPRFPNGSSNSVAISRGSDTNTGVYFSGTQTRLAANGRNALIVQNNGNVTRENSVMFHSTGTSGWRYANSYGGPGWRTLNGNFGWSSYQRGGSNFNNNNGRFTAPVSGFYHFNFQTYGYNNTNTTSGYVHLSFGINGGNNMVGGRNPHGIWMHGTFNRHANGILMDLGTYLNAGQYVNVRVFWRNNQSRFHGAHSIFNGYMVA